MAAGRRRWAGALAFGAAVVCGGPGVAADPAQNAQSANANANAAKVAVTIESATGAHIFRVEIARTRAQQDRGLMFRTDIPADGGMLFTPYPAEGPPREASFWMKNTPSPLDILFIRRNGTIATIAANATPFSETPVRSGEAVGAVLEINGGKAAELGIRVGDKVRWPPVAR